MYAVIMAGGVGKRFWPRSRREIPKQMLDIVSEKSMLTLTYNRLKKITDEGKVYVVTGQSLYESIFDELKELPEGNFIIEPSGKNTAPCIGLAAIIIGAKDPDAIIGVFPADHLISDHSSFTKSVKIGAEVAKSKNSLVTFGIIPTQPLTGYGYIQFDKKKAILDNTVFKVKTFAEKPNLNTARRFLSSGEFLWNSGIFIWKVSSILNAIKVYLPGLYESLRIIKEAIDTPRYDTVLRKQWATIHSESIDYGIMEKAKNVYVVKGRFDWSDVGSWDSVYEIKEKDENGNVLIGNTVTIDTKGCYVYSPKSLVSTVGVEDLIIVQTKDALLITRRGKSEKVKDLVDILRREKRSDYL